MTPRFTIVPETDFEHVAHEVARRARSDRNILVAPGGDVHLHFAGREEVAALARQKGLACLRIMGREQILHVEAEGYEASVEHLRGFVLWILEVFPPQAVFDDETGEDITLTAVEDFHSLFAPEPEFAAP